MTIPTQPEKRASTKTAFHESIPRTQPKFTLLNEKQWDYIQRHFRMSPRELQVARLVCRGFTNADVANKLSVKEGTVKTHLRSIFSKVRARNKISLLLRFIHTAGILKGGPFSSVPFQRIEPQNPIEEPPPALGRY